MLSTSELAGYCSRHNLPPVARRVIEQVRSSPPSRRVKSSAANVACRYASRKMQGVIQAESHKNELPAVVAWEHDEGTHEFYDQPPKIKVSYRVANGRAVSHLITPDFFLLQEGFAGWVECKTEEWLQTRHAEGSGLYVPDGHGHWRCPPGEEYAAALGLGFRVRSSAETNWVKHRNLEFLADYLDERCPAPKPEDVERIRCIFCNRAWIPVKELLDADHGVAADAIHKMIADGILYVDLDRDIVAEPERTLVFRDKLSAEAHRIHLASLQLPSMPEFLSVTVSAGQSMLWDGKPWRILNVGDEDVFMEDSDRIITSLRRQVLEQLVRDGRVTGLPQGIQLNRDKVDEAIRSASPGDFEHALYRFRCLFPDKAGGAVSQACERAIRYWRALYRKSAELYGSGFIGLLPKIHLRGNRNRKLDDQVIEIMKKAIDEHFAKPGEKTLVSCWGEVRNECEAMGLPPPSENAFRAEIRRRDQHALQVVREGEKAAYDTEEFYWQLERTTPRHGERPFEIGHIDHTELDLNFVGSRRGEKLGRAWLTVMIDAYTRMILAWAVLFEEPSYRSCLAVMRDCVRRHGRVPKYIVVDKGSEFESVYFECLLARLENHKKTRPGGKPRFGSIIERVFGITNKDFIHNLIGNNQALQRPRRLSETHDPRRLAVWTLPEFNDAFQGFLDKVYSEAEHPALGLSPKQAIVVGLAQAGQRKHTLIPYSDNFIIMCMPSTKQGTAKVEPGRGVKINYIRYWTPEFRDPSYAGQKVPVRYDPFDASVAFAWLRDHWAPCRSELAAEFQGRSEKEIGIVTQEIRARFRRTGQRRAIKASLIAQYLRETTATEKILTQRKRHQETLDALHQHRESMPQLPTPDMGAHTEDDSVWSNLTLKIVGEFA